MHTTGNQAAQDSAVQRAQVAFHRYAAFGEPDKAMERYRTRNDWRKALIERERDAIGPMSPFAEIGANAGYTSYMLASAFGSRGFAADISEDALRQGIALREVWPSAHPPVLAAADALRLPFRSGSIRFAMSFQLLSQFQQIEPVIAEIHRILAPGGVYLFADEPVRRKLTLGLFRAPYPEFMPPWQRRLHRAGLLDFAAADVIGAAQEERAGIRQNHRMSMLDWRTLLSKYFEETRLDAGLREEGPFNGAVRGVVRRWSGSAWRERAADLLGGSLTGVCRKAGASVREAPEDLLTLLACPDCGSSFTSGEMLRCPACGYEILRRGGVFNCLPLEHRRRLYPDCPESAMDCNTEGHERAIVSGFHELDGSGGNRFRWIGRKARVRLQSSFSGPAALSVSGFAHPGNCPVRLSVSVNGVESKPENIEEPGVFLLEREVAASVEYDIELGASPVWTPAGEDREFTLVLNAVRVSAP